MNYRYLHFSLFFALVFCISGNTYGQTSISGIINNYTPVTGVNTACNYVAVSSTAGFAIGEKVLLIQMKGASVNGAQSNAFGTITSYGNSGNYEFNEVYDIQGLLVYLKYTILKTYDPQGLQLVTIPQYGDVNITGVLTATPWNGSIGGVLVFESSGIVTFNADINVEGLGFKGGDRSPANTLNTCSYGAGTWYAALNTVGYGAKGESISSFIAGRESAQANQASGGGGGHSSNTGAGGGANYGKGGIGGSQSNKPTGGGCNIFGVGSKGMGGVALASNYSNAINKIFLGGGGGGGQQNNYTAPGPPFGIGATAGNPGGGIVIIRASTIVGNGYNIFAAGYNNNSLNAATLVGFSNGVKRSWGDSGGGGGAGGAVLLSTSNYASSILNVDVRGGRGDTVFTEIEINLGPGGGGGGGVLWVSNPTMDPNIIAKTTGGVTGISWNTAFPTVCGCSFGSAAGDPGVVLNNLVISENSTAFSPCFPTPVTLLKYAGKQVEDKIYLNWVTTSEVNNDYFIIEKSSDDLNYKYLAKLTGKGNNNVISQYSYIDESPLSGLNYYRLKQYDYNQKEYILGYVSIDFSETVIEKIYPNPFTNELIVESSDILDKSSTSIKIINLLGVELTANYQFDGRIIKIDANTLSKGIYYLHLLCGDSVEIRKIIKE